MLGGTPRLLSLALFAHNILHIPRSIPLEIIIGKLPYFRETIRMEDTMVEVRHFMKPIHVELSDKRRKVVVFEMPAQDMFRQVLRIGDNERRALRIPVHPGVRLRRIHHPKQLIQERWERVLRGDRRGRGCCSIGTVRMGIAGSLGYWGGSVVVDAVVDVVVLRLRHKLEVFFLREMKSEKDQEVSLTVVAADPL